MTNDIYTKIFSGEEVLSRLDQILAPIKHRLDSFQKPNNLITSIDDEIIMFDGIYRLLGFSHPDDKLGQLLNKLLVDTTIKSEMISPGSSIFMLSLIMNINQTIDHESMIDDVIDSSEDVSNDSLIQTVSTWIQNKEQRKIIIEAINLAGCDGKMFVIESKSSKVPIIEQLDGYVFGLASPIQHETVWSQNNVACLIIDGIIENVAEIHNILNFCADKHQPLCVVSRGFSNDVLSTVSFNNLRKTLDILPIIVPFDMCSVNMLNDVAVVAGTDVISSIKGQLISTFNPSCMVECETIEYDHGSLMIKNTKTKKDVGNQLKELNKKRKIACNEEQTTIDNRIKSLTGKSTKIYIPTTINKSLSLEKIDFGLRLVKMAMQYGISQISSIKQFERLLNIETAPTMSMVQGIRTAKVFDKLVRSIDKSIVVDV